MRDTVLLLNADDGRLVSYSILTFGKMINDQWVNADTLTAARRLNSLNGNIYFRPFQNIAN